MKTVSNKRSSSEKPKKKKSVKRGFWKRPHKQKFGTSKLEMDFAHLFLDKLGVDYDWQFEAKDIGRFFDFYCSKENIIIEVNGTYWHGDPRVYEAKDLNATQKRDIYIDELKHKWALMRGIPVYYFWEKDIREDPGSVMKKLKEILHLEGNKQLLKEEMKNKRHVNKLKK